MENKIFKERRNALLQHIKDGVAVLPAATSVTKSNDTDFPFRQESNFHYLTGFPEPEGVLVLLGNNDKHQSVLFVRPNDPVAEQWSGRRIGIEGAQENLEIDKVFSLDDLESELPELLLGHANIFIDIFSDGYFPNKVRKICQQLGQRKKKKVASPTSFHHINPVVGRMRLIKDQTEIELMRKASAITDKAHRAAMAFSEPGKMEYQVSALLEYIFKTDGGRGYAYESIVAGGDNANILHYVENSMVLKDNELLLIDAGSEYHYYASDVTRTFPINGKFNPAQKDLYEIVLESQNKTIEGVLPGGTLDKNHTLASKILIQGLVDLKILKGSVDEIFEKGDHKKYYPHGTGHWLGLDVHDNSPYYDGQFRDLEFVPGMVFTVEPGLYLPKEDENIPEAFRGIGIRIEDDIVITDKGYENLSSKIPKEIDKVESACQEDPKQFLL